MIDNNPSIEEIACDWWAYQRLNSGTRDERKSLENQRTAIVIAWEVVDERIQEGGPGSLDLIIALIDAASSENDIRLIGSGPLEDLLHDHAESIINDIERVARGHAGFRTALSAACVSLDSFSKDVRSRLEPWIAGSIRRTSG